MIKLDVNESILSLVIFTLNYQSLNLPLKNDLNFYHSNDIQAVKIKNLTLKNNLATVIKIVTDLTDEKILNKIINK